MFGNIFKRKDTFKQPEPSQDMFSEGEGAPFPRVAKIYYYVGAMKDGQPVVLGRYYTWEQADRMGREKLGQIPYKIYPKSFGDMSKATREIKYDLLSPNNMDMVLQRARHVVDEDE